MAGAEVSLAELGMAGAAFASSTAADVPLAERGMAVVDFASTTVAEVSVAGLITAGAEAACAWRSACSNKVETCSSLVCSCADSTPPLPITCTIIPATWRMSSGAMPLSNPGMADTVASSSSLMSKACRRTRWRKTCMSKSFAKWGRASSSACRKCRPSASPRAASTKNSARMTASASPPL